jgi:hypothetical protein
MKFLITMNMPSSSGRDVHSIIGEYPAADVGEFMDVLEGNGFIIVEEYFIEKHNGPGAQQSVKSNGDIAINFLHVGKVKLYEDAQLS